MQNKPLNSLILFKLLLNECYFPLDKIKNIPLLWSVHYSEDISIHTACLHQRWPSLQPLIWCRKLFSGIRSNYHHQFQAAFSFRAFSFRLFSFFFLSFLVQWRNPDPEDETRTANHIELSQEKLREQFQPSLQFLMYIRRDKHKHSVKMAIILLAFYTGMLRRLEIGRK